MQFAPGQTFRFFAIWHVDVQQDELIRSGFADHFLDGASSGDGSTRTQLLEQNLKASGKQVVIIDEQYLDVSKCSLRSVQCK